MKDVISKVILQLFFVPRTWIFVFLLCVYAAMPLHANNFIRWSPERRLSWNDFQGTVDPNRNPNTQAIAMVMLEVKTTAEDTRVVFQVSSSFNKSGSWTINRTSEHILQHEQLHFDIAELHARKLRRKLSDMRGLTFRNLKARVDEAYRIVQQSHDSMQKRYDRETNHSNNIKVQEEWNRNIPSLLYDLKEYSDTIVFQTIQ